MDASGIFQTESILAATQWIVFDTTINNRFSCELQKRSSGIDWINVNLDEIGKMNDTKKHKQLYISKRPLYLNSFSKIYEKGMRDGSTRGRVVIWVVGDVSDPRSSLLLNELPLDLVNFSFWKRKYIPPVVRIGIGCESDQYAFLSKIEYQYFSFPNFQNNSFQYQKEELIIRANPFDSFFGSESDQPVLSLFNHLVPLHEKETAYAIANYSDKLSSGGRILTINKVIVVSVSSWRCIDWLALCQPNFFPRYWSLDDPALLKELIHLLDCSGWKAKFLKDLDSVKNEVMDPRDFNPYPQEVSDDEFGDEEELEEILGLNLKQNKPSSAVIQRRTREKNWDKLRVHFPIRIQVVDAPAMVEEKNRFRITEGDFETLKELVYCLQRYSKNKESLEVIELFTIKKRTDLPPVFLKLKAIALLKLGDKNAQNLLHKYREDILINFEEESVLGKSFSDSEKAKIFAEIGSVALLEDDITVASDYSLKALELCPSMVEALKTLTWSSSKSGKTSFENEDLIFKFLISIPNPTGNEEGPEAYYTSVLQRYPENGLYQYYYATYLFLVANQPDKAESYYQQSIINLPHSPRVMESYATFLFQTSTTKTLKKKISKIEDLYRKSLDLFSKEGDSSRILLTKANFSSFLLVVGHSTYKSESIQAKEDRKKEGLRLLDEVLYSPNLFEENLQLATECWFYALVYGDFKKYYEYMQNLKFALKQGGRAPGWNLSFHVDYCNRSKHPDANWISKLVPVINGNSPPQDLTGWERWERCLVKSLCKKPGVAGNEAVSTTLFGPCYSKDPTQEPKIEPDTKTTQKKELNLKRKCFLFEEKNNKRPKINSSLNNKFNNKLDKENNNNSNNAKAKANRNKTNNSTNDIKTTNNNHKTTNSNKNDNVPSSHLDSDSDEDLFKELEYVPKKVERTTNPKPMPTQMANANPLAIKSQPPPSPLSDITPNRPTTKKRT